MEQLKDLVHDIIQRKVENKVINIYILRHGETDFNKQGKVQGQEVNLNLNDTGKEQAHKTGKHIVSEKPVFDKIYCSPLSRAKETAQIIASYVNYEEDIIYDDRLLEKKVGIMSGKTGAEIDSHIDSVPELKELKEKLDKGDIRYDDYDVEHSKLTNGETKKNAGLRGFDFLKDVLDKNDKNVLIVAHGCLLKNMLRNAIPRTDFKMSNCALTVIEYNDGKFDLISRTNNKHIQ
jgi:broad specificity phosphatase PhoE